MSADEPPAGDAGDAAGPNCPGCGVVMTRTGWVPVPVAGRSGESERVPVFRCPRCGRLFDARWGFREATGDL